MSRLPGYASLASGLLVPRRIAERGAQLDAVGVGTYTLGAEAILSSTVNARGDFYFDPADYALAGYIVKLRLRQTIYANATASGVNFLAEMYPVTALTGAAAAVTNTRGALVAGSPATVNTPAAGVPSAPAVALFTAPAADHYVLTCTNSGAMAASSSVTVRVSLDVVLV